uniref:7-cyano-7-deazaguanine tRNA-ribosyltransferase n=1 Tax=Lygus hesperus TaxID=30085 RepID=A0A0A9WSF9_LYGHE
MLTMFVVFLCAFIALGAAEDTPNCILMNEEMESVLNSTNKQIEESQDTYQEFAFFVQQDVDLFLLNAKLPFVASLYLTKGRMGRLDSLRRHGDIWNCSTPDMRSLQGVYKYDELFISYDMNVTFLRWHVTGKFVYRVSPYIAIGIVKGTQNCNLEIYEMVKMDPGEYEITMEDSWMGWLVGKFLRHSLQGVENESLLGTVLQTSTGNVNEYLGENICETILDFNFSDYTPY